ncbi:hypothetical protein GCM10027051_36430 [Niabella terrae]
MCYDISFEIKMRQLSDYFPELIFDGQIDLDFQAFDHVQGVSVFAPHPILYVNRDDLQLHCRAMQWGVVEFYRKELPDWRRRNGMLNIRAERVLADPQSYWHRIRNRRCLIPVSGIYEHRGIRGWKKKVPYWVKPREQEVFFLPGLYSRVELADRETGELVDLWSFGMITRSANALMRDIHNSGENTHRMPLFLPLEEAREFLDESLSTERYAALLNYEMPATSLEAHPVYTIRTAKMRPDGRSKSAYFEWPKLPELGQMNPEA